ncbi:aminotransferase class I/II-fold pyridoxal phosphate-dependent enzyme [Actinosynnema sp. NPDC047251]|uniref:homocysteine desulfhydrase n=1 Tax=Saccharothrix espanaensis (strain ATCC 51144 / DSM 44229 / JCM 9112 / NBRC 15066 / NRRL 15764) TaxID=1179773 RepID=K0JYI7_SACES|nr:aminotransferase class I/II-fold pyridoxal phosphate-dependent enzyme [Saccharothrix espanaensis]CCH30372.1 Methionine gamma-lyase [Saccharothrix espanaensis DSM 44229]
MTRLRTTAVHGGRDDLAELGVHAPPIDLSTTYPVPDQAEGGDALQALAEGAAHATSPVYSRLHNPTVARFENALAALELTEAAVAFGSGMAAVTAVVQAACVLTTKPHVVAVRPLYGGTDHLLSSGLLGVRTTYTTADDVAAAITPDTGLIVLETPANPNLDLIDIAHVVAQAGHVPVMVDNTFATPILQNPAPLGATYVLHSGTKYLGGHGDVLGGVVACAESEAKALRQVRIITGAVLHPLGGYLLHRGLATLPLRVEAAQRTATELAHRLSEHPAVTTVRHPSLTANPLLGTQLRGPGAMLAFTPTENPNAIVRRLRLITPAVSLGSVDTLVEHPAALTHRLVPAADRHASGVPDNLLRLSAGLEDVEDLWDDLDQALSGNSKPASTCDTDYIKSSSSQFRALSRSN